MNHRALAAEIADSIASRIGPAIQSRVDSALQQLRDRPAVQEAEFLQFSDGFRDGIGGTSREQDREMFRRLSATDRRELMDTVRKARPSQATAPDASRVYRFADDLRSGGVDVDALYRDICALPAAQQAEIMTHFSGE